MGREAEAGRFQFLLKQRQSSPGKLSTVTPSIRIDGAPLHEVADYRVRVVGTFTAVPMQKCARIVLLIPELRDLSDLAQSVRKIIEHSGCDRTLGAIAHYDLQG